MALGDLLNTTSAVSTEKFFLVTTPNITSLTKAISSNLLLYLTPAFTIGAIYEFCKGGRFFDLLLKLIIACAFISSGQTLIEAGCKEGFKLSDQIATWASGGSSSGNWLPRFILNSSSKEELKKLKNRDLKDLGVFSKASQTPSVKYIVTKSMRQENVGYGPFEMDVDGSTEQEISDASNLSKNGIPDFGISDTVMIGVLLGACMIVKLIFTAGYYLSIALLVVPCLLLFIPTFESSFSGMIKTMFFCWLLPIVFTILLFLLGEMIQDSFFDPRIVSIEKTVMLVVMSIIVVMSVFITWAILSATGVAGALSGTAAMMGSQLIRQTVGAATGAGLGGIKSAIVGSAIGLVKNPFVMELLASKLGNYANANSNSLLGKLAQRGANSANQHLKKYSPYPSFTQKKPNKKSTHNSPFTKNTQDLLSSSHSLPQSPLSSKQAINSKITNKSPQSVPPSSPNPEEELCAASFIRRSPLEKRPLHPLDTKTKKIPQKRFSENLKNSSLPTVAEKKIQNNQTLNKKRQINHKRQT